MDRRTANAVKRANDCTSILFIFKLHSSLCSAKRSTGNSCCNNELFGREGSVTRVTGLSLRRLDNGMNNKSITQFSSVFHSDGQVKFTGLSRQCLHACE